MRPLTVARVRYKGGEALVSFADPRELKSFRTILKMVNQRMTLKQLPTVTAGRATRLLFEELASMDKITRLALRRHPEVLDAIAEFR